MTFETRRGEISVACTIEPGYETVRLRLALGDRELVDLDLQEVLTVDVEYVGERELLRIHLRDQGAGTLFLRLAPAVFLGWRVGQVW